MAADAKKRQAAFLAQDARQWRDLARQAEHWERVRDMMPKNLPHDQSALLPHIDLGGEDLSRRLHKLRAVPRRA